MVFHYQYLEKAVRTFVAEPAAFVAFFLAFLQDNVLCWVVLLRDFEVVHAVSVVSVQQHHLLCQLPWGRLPVLFVQAVDCLAVDRWTDGVDGQMGGRMNGRGD